MRLSSGSLSSGTVLGPYQIVGRLGAGGMGEVYRALDTRLDRTIAIKVLPSGFGDDRDRLRRFEQEAKAASALNHPNILTIYDIGQEAGVAFIAMEWVQGKNLRELLEKRLFVAGIHCAHPATLDPGRPGLGLRDRGHLGLLLHDRQGDARPEECAREPIAAKLVGAEEMLPAGRLQDPFWHQIDGVRVVGRDHWREESGQAEDDQEGQSAAGQSVAAELIPGAQEERTFR